MSGQLLDILRQAVALHDRGELKEARRLLKHVLRKRPDQFGAVHLLGLIEAQRGNPEKAERLLFDALRANPNSAEAHANLGNIQSSLEKFEAALASYDRALQIRPNYPNALNSRGTVLAALKRHEDAVKSYAMALAIEPRFAAALHNRAVALRAMGRLADALADCDRALEIDPRFAATHSERGRLLAEISRLEEALQAYDRSLELDPRSKDAFYDRGLVLIKLRRFEAAIASFDKALQIDPTFVTALINRGSCLQELNRQQEALASYDAALAIEPDLAAALDNRGSVLLELNRVDEALESFDKAIARKPDLASAFYNRGTALIELRRVEEALANFDQAIARQPDFPSAIWNRGLGRLLLGRYREGWDDHEWRWKSDRMISAQREFAQPQWDGRVDILGKTILLHAEQGFGDAIMAARYVQRVVQTGSLVILEVPTDLVPLLAEIDGVAQVVARGQALPEFDCHCPLMSLPRAFDTTLETIPADVPYLSVPETHRKKWEARLPKTRALRVGVNWAGNVVHPNDRNRSIEAIHMLPLLLKMDTQIFSLQRDLREGDAALLRDYPQIANLSEGRESFADTAAIVSWMDLIISIDTSIVHLAGALAKPVWILLSFAADWRWLLDRDDSPWYPTARLFRQPSRGDWASVTQRVAKELSAYASEHASTQS
jgi:tetratricopeptide (TPR) repeat protein